MKPDGELMGRVVLPDGRWFPFKGDTLIEEIGGNDLRHTFERWYPGLKTDIAPTQEDAA